MEPELRPPSGKQCVPATQSPGSSVLQLPPLGMAQTSQQPQVSFTFHALQSAASGHWSSTHGLQNIALPVEIAASRQQVRVATVTTVVISLES